MLKIAADNDVIGQVAALVTRLTRPPLDELWSALDPEVHDFESLGLLRDASDRSVWLACQRESVVLLTGNRNSEGPDSLEATIRDSNGPACLPVLTFSRPGRILRSGAYAERVAVRLLEYAYDLEQYRGAGRLYLP